MKKRKIIENDELNNVEINELLDKMLKLQENSKAPSFLKKNCLCCDGYRCYYVYWFNMLCCI